MLRQAAATYMRNVRSVFAIVRERLTEERSELLVEVRRAVSAGQ